MIHRESFQRDYDFFWSLSPIERSIVDGSIVPLIFVMLAMGTQFVALPSADEKEQTAEFYGKVGPIQHKNSTNPSLNSVSIAPGVESH